jgi:formylglycine-generating enzyme required for sulfatase activity
MAPCLLLAALAVAAPLGPQDAPAAGPPGTLYVAGGRTTIGSRTEDVEGWIVENVQVAGTLVGETPQHVVVVESFYLMPTEVTNEQYAAFVAATGAAPPVPWGAPAIEEARRSFFEQESRRVEEARALGQEVTARPWDPAAWWDEHWQENPWKVPESERTSPVVYVDYEDARTYARWAGLRLMTEPEFQRAARGNSERIWPWGSDWDPEACNSIHDKDSNRALPVASFPAGAAHGIHDLVGNVWEWTQSPYVAYPGYHPMKVKAGRRTLDALAEWDSTAQVLVGGSFAQTEVGCRVAVRQKGERDQRAEALGLRCAASVEPGRDAAEWILARFLALHPRTASAQFVPSRAVTLRRWTSVPGSVGVDAYAVITGYQEVVFCPVDSLPGSSEPELARTARARGPLLLGFLSSSVAIADPPLAPGIHLVSYGKGDGAAEEGGATGLLLHDLRGSLVAALPPAGALALRSEPVSGIELLSGEPGEPARLRVRSTLSGDTAAKHFGVEFELGFAPGTVDSSWR